MLEGLSTAEGLIVAGNSEWTDYTFQSAGRIVADSVSKELALVFRYGDQENFYWAGLGCWGHRVSIGKKIAGAVSEIAYAGTRDEIVAGQTYELKVMLQGNQIHLYVDGQLALSVSDDARTAGKIGYRIYNSHVELDYASATENVVGTTVILTGTVSAQAHDEEVVTITVTKPDGTPEVLVTATTVDKTFSYTTQYTVPGEYSAYAEIDADSLWSAAKSNTVTFNVGVGTRIITLSWRIGSSD